MLPFFKGGVQHIHLLINQARTREIPQAGHTKQHAKSRVYADGYEIQSST